MKKVVLFMMMAVLLLSVPTFVMAGDNVGDTICPVSGEEVGKMGDTVTVEYQGKEYNLCCLMCKKDFLKDPEKYSKIAEDQARQHKMEEGEGHMHGEHDE